MCINYPVASPSLLSSPNTCTITSKIIRHYILSPSRNLASVRFHQSSALHPATADSASAEQRSEQRLLIASMVATHSSKTSVRLVLRTVYFNTNYLPFLRVPWLYHSHFTFFMACHFPSHYASFPPLCNIFTTPLAYPRSIHSWLTMSEGGSYPTHPIDTTMSQAPWIAAQGGLTNCWVACVPTTVSTPSLIRFHPISD